MISKFRSKLHEGHVYRIFNFTFVSNSDNFMASDHEFKLLFNERTQTILEESPAIPMNVFSFKNSEEILATGGESDYLIGMCLSYTSILHLNRIFNYPISQL